MPRVFCPWYCCCLFVWVRHCKNSVAPLIKRARTICRPQGVVIPESFYPGSAVSEENNNSQDRFPTTTFGNDDFMKKEVIP